MKLILATKNRGKIRELSEILSEHEIISMTDAGFVDEIEETGTTFEENAMIKAEAVCTASGLPVIADDSGLEVYALDMRPGIFSARYAGENATDEERVEKLLREMEGETDRRARFVCAAAMCFPDGSRHTFRGEVEGTLALSPRGNGGFGYDPIFMYGNKSFAELSDEEKNAVSHRKRAFYSLSVFLKNK